MSESMILGKVICLGPKGSGKTTFVNFLKTGRVESNNLYYSTLDVENIELNWASDSLVKEPGMKIRLTAALDTPGTELDIFSWKRNRALSGVLSNLEKWVREKEQENATRVVFIFYFINIAFFIENNKCKDMLHFKKIKKKLYERVIGLDSSWFEVNKNIFMNLKNKLDNNLRLGFVVTHKDCVANENEIKDILSSNRYITRLSSIFSSINSYPVTYFIGSLKDSQAAMKLIREIFEYYLNK